jgi:hypothetical protein
MTLTVTREQLGFARAALAAQGIDVVGDSGLIEHRGVKASFNYVEPTLTIAIIEKPFYVSESYAEGQIANWFNNQPVPSGNR